MNLRDGLLKILDGYPSARSEPLKGHPLAKFVRMELPESIRVLLTELGGSAELLVRGTKFMGSWAYVPWLAILDPTITKTNQKGVYVVYLFSEDGKSLLLSIGEGVTVISEEDLIEDRGRILQAFSPPPGFDPGPAPEGSLGSSSSAHSYERALVCFKRYSRDGLPEEAALRTDLLEAVGYVEKIASSPLVEELSWTRENELPNVDEVDWKGKSIAADEVAQAFEITEASDWSGRPGIDPYWIVSIHGVSKPLKAVLRNVADVGPNAEFTTHEGAALLRKLGFMVSKVRDSGPLESKQNRRSWAIAPGKDAALWDRAVKNQEVAIAWDDLGDLSGYSGIEEVAAALVKIYGGDRKPTNNALCNWEFSHVMQPGDLVYAKKGLRVLVGIGVVTGGYKWDETLSAARHTRPVKWLKVGQWELPEGMQFAMKTLTDITAYPEFVQGLNKLAGFDDLQTTKQLEPELESLVIAPQYSIQLLAQHTGHAESSLQAWISRLHRKKHIVIQGPPGTGKTFLAKGLGKVLVSESNGIVDMVQFHPSYAYEDFIQGIRPALVGGALSFRLESGRFLEFCERARRVHPAPALLIIDELNRANLSRVFGELMYLLEYRDDEVPLAGGGERFSIPDNVFLIGTMNTADRSIALVDHALRRRFSFVHLGPDYQILESYLNRHGLPAESLVNALRAVNEAIDDPNYEVGVSYFLKDGPALRSTLREVWEGEIEPYLEEFFYDQTEKVDGLRFSKLSAGVLKPWL